MDDIPQKVKDDVIRDNTLTKTAISVNIQHWLYNHFERTFSYEIFITCCNYGLLFAYSFLKSGPKFLTYEHAKRMIRPEEFTIYCKSLNIYANFTLQTFSGWLRNLSDNKDNLTDTEFIDLITLIDLNQIIDGDSSQKLTFMCLQCNVESIKNIVEQLYNNSANVISTNNGISYIILNYLIKNSSQWLIEINKIYDTVATVKLAYANSIIRNYDYNSDSKNMLILPFTILDRQKLNDEDICSLLVPVKQLNQNNVNLPLNDNDKINRWIIANPPPKIIKTRYHKLFIYDTKYDISFNDFADVCNTVFDTYRVKKGMAWKIKG